MSQAGLWIGAPAPHDGGLSRSSLAGATLLRRANSSNGTLLVSYDYTLEGGGSAHFDAAIDVGSLPPCQPMGVPDYPHPGYTC